MSRKGSVISITGEIVVFDTDQEKKLNKDETNIPRNTGPKFGKRHIELLFLFSLVFINQSMRQHLSLTIVAMTDPNASSNKDIVTFNWTNKNVILSSFFWGYIWPQIFSGWIMTKYGHKWFIVAMTTIVSTLSLLTPWIAINLGSYAVMVSRVMQGAAQAFMVPSTSCFISRWVPISERSRSGAFIFAGTPAAAVVTMAVAGLFAASTFGWPLTFYVTSFFGFLWAILYSFFGYSFPKDHPHISMEEKTFIEDSTVSSNVKNLKTPWKDMVKSAPFWATFYTYVTYIYFVWVLLSEIPTYMSKIMIFDIHSNGLLTSLLYLSQWIFGFIISAVGDYLINKNYFSRTVIRKLLTAIGLFIPSITLIILAQCDKDSSTLGVVLLIFCVALQGANLSGVLISNVDIAPNFAGILQGFYNGLAHVFAAIAPLGVQFMIDDESNPSQWKHVFYLTSAVSISGAIVFGVFGSGEPQHWNFVEEMDIKDTKEAAKLNPQRS